MKKILIFIVLSLFFIGCGSSGPEISEKPIEQKKSSETKNGQPETVAAHTLDKENDAKAMPTVPKSEADKVDMVKSPDKKTKWTRSGNPIDTSKFDEDVKKAEKDFKAKSNDETAKKNLSEAYTKRGVALTEARQYAAAIGDYRKALKYNPENAEAKKWIATITNIYKSINREVPKEGEEPKPLEFKTEKS
jgi:tetratricopeptide (TPR) repeat protein